MPIEKDPILKELSQLIHRYVAANQGKVAFVINVVAHSGHGTCEGCEEESHDMYDESKSTLMAFGELELLRNLCNEARDAVEDGSNRMGFVQI